MDLPLAQGRTKEDGSLRAILPRSINEAIEALRPLQRHQRTVLRMRCDEGGIEAKRFVSDPRELVKAGEVVRVRVLEVDEERQRVALALVREARDEDEDHGRRDRRPARAKADKPRITALAAELSVLKKNQ